MLSSLDIPIAVFMAEANECIKQALLKWVEKSRQLLSVRITQKKFRVHATKTIWFTQHSVTQIDCSVYCMYIFDAADLVTFSEDL